MIRRLLRAWAAWRLRDVSFRELALQHYILTKSARRCAYDLEHAIDDMKRGSWQRELFEKRYGHWVRVFSINGVKDYRIELEEKLDDQQQIIAQLDALVLELGGKIPPRRTPF